jgi:hypothetical protein
MLYVNYFFIPDEKEDHPIYGGSTLYGPIFGGGHDLCITNKPN